VWFSHDSLVPLSRCKLALDRFLPDVVVGGPGGAGAAAGAANQKPLTTEKARLPSAFVCINFPMWAPKAADGEGASTHEVPTGPTWQQMARNNAATFVVKLDGQGMGVATGAMNDSFNRELWAQPIFVEAFTIKGGMPLICRLASAASDDNLFYK